MSPYQTLLKEQSDLQSDLDRTNEQLSAVQAQIALYDAAKSLRPKGIPDSWEPIIDFAGVLQGWYNAGDPLDTSATKIQVVS